MSFTNLHPPPELYSDVAPSDLDKSPGMDCSASLTARGGLTITAVGAPIITRTDDAVITSADLTVSNVAVALPATAFGWWFIGGTNLGTYLIDFPITLSDGSILHRSASVSVAANVG